MGEKNKIKSEDDWLPVSDLMAGLMIVFLFISVALMRQTQKERETIKNIAETYKQNKVEIYNSLQNVFGKELKNIGASIDPNNLSISLEENKILFKNGDINFEKKSADFLKSFFPKYINEIYKFKEHILEIRIEGHTNTLWNKSYQKEKNPYIGNMGISQERARQVLKYVYSLDALRDKKKWMQKHLVAVGYSFSKLIVKNGKEDKRASRRVTFRIITNSEDSLRKILEEKNE